ncbi:MAG: DNA-3-methyladenine glycosylase I [Gammaproteobacteria bacterium]|nr:DNA-3-methyladenine glycosylase I [Gammaproteobacteria bacterium]MDH5629150.1 DNA-3-methyladenine glycosylase I [Gammaproteobacteria bacterium]
MENFSQILQRATERKGGAAQLEALLPKVKTSQQISQISNQTCLSEMSKKIFQSGFVWRVVEAKWPGFEEVFWQFQPEKLVLASDEQIEKMSQDTRIIRNFTKVKSIRHNANFILEISEKHGSFGQFLSEWPENNIIELWQLLKKQGSRLGGNTGPYFLRTIGKDTFLLSQDTVGYFISQNVISRHPTSMRDLNLIQNIFNDLQQQSGMSYSEISRIISLSFGDNIM